MAIEHRDVIELLRAAADDIERNAEVLESAEVDYINDHAGTVMNVQLALRFMKRGGIALPAFEDIVVKLSHT